MSKKKQQVELDKSERIMKHERSHQKDQQPTAEMKKLQPKHKPVKRHHTNFLDVYEKYGDDYEELIED